MANPHRILVTGGCGYLGSQLIRDLSNSDIHDIRIRILDNMQEKNYQSLLNLPENCYYEFIEGDILDPLTLQYALQNIDIVIHLAAIVRTPMSFENPAWIEQVNRWGTARLVEACIEAGIQRFIFGSSTAVYGPGGPFNENDLCRPLGPYAQSKYKAEKSIETALARGLNSTILRFGTLFGYAPAMRFDAVANRFAYMAGTNRPVTIFGKGDQIRPIIHVRDASDAICFCIKEPQTTSSHVFNVIDDNKSILDIVDIIKNIIPDLEVKYTEQDILTHLSFQINNEKFTSFGWSPSVTIQYGFKELLNHFKGFARVRKSLDIEQWIESE